MSIGMHATTDRSLHWLYVIFLAHSNAFARSKSSLKHVLWPLFFLSGGFGATWHIIKC